MQIVNFIKSLLPRIKRDDILEDINITSKELSNGVIPSYLEASKFFSEYCFKSEGVADLVNVFKRNYTSHVNGASSNLLVEIHRALGVVLENLNTVNDNLNDLLEEDTLTTSITARKASLIRASEHITFISIYSLGLLDLIYGYEIAHVRNEKLVITPSMHKNLIMLLPTYARLLETYSVDNKQFVNKIKAIPEVIISEDSYAAVAAVYKKDLLSPLNAPAVSGFIGNPIYHLRLVVAEWQAERYKANRERKQLLEIKLLNLKLASEGKNDPKLDKEIEYIQNRIETIEYKLIKMERDVEHV